MTLTPVSAVRVRRTVSFLRDLVGELRDSNVPFMAGSIAYSVFVSLLPLLVLLLLVASTVGGERVAGIVVSLTEQYLSPTGQQVVADSLLQASEQTELSILTILIFVWATLRIFRGLDTAFSILYDTGGHNGVVTQLKNAGTILATLALGFVGTVGASILFTRLPMLPFSNLLEVVFLLFFLSSVFLPLYYLVPNVSLSVREVLPGVAVAAIGWTVLEAGFKFYVAISPQAELYGVVGGIILLITWLYLGALVVLLGATVNVVLQRRSSAVQSGQPAHEP